MHSNRKELTIVPIPAWMKLKSIILGEKCQTQQDTSSVGLRTPKQPGLPGTVLVYT